MIRQTSLYLPQRLSLVSQTRGVLMAGMRDGRWQKILPGERLLAAELQVSRWTLRAALEKLACGGSLKITQGRACKIILRPVGRKSRSRAVRIALLVPTGLLQSRMFAALWTTKLREILQDQGIDLDIVDSVKAYRTRPTHVLQSLVASYPHSGWLLVHSTSAMQEWFEARGLPTLVAGSRFDKIRLPALDIDHYAAAVHAGHIVHGSGHRHVALLGPRAIAGVIATEGGLRSALSRARPAAELTAAWAGGDKTEICRALDHLLAGPFRPTVLIVSRAHATLTVFSHLSRLGLAVPRDLSLISMEWEPFLENLVPDIARYEVSPVHYARRTVWALLRRIAEPEFCAESFMEPKFIGGGSLGRPRRDSLRSFKTPG